MSINLPLGPVMLDVKGLVLEDDDQALLAHPLTGGVILFARNYESPEQLRALTTSIHAIRNPKLLIAVDHEGGRVQRFKDGFTIIPPMAELEGLGGAASQVARALGTVIANELLDHGIDFSFTPVLDVAFGRSSVIGNRAFSSDPQVLAMLAGALIEGLHAAGMASVGKHFPGHGHVQADSHTAVPVDDRHRGEIDACDILPYRRLIPKGLRAVMPAHVIFPQVDSQPAGFSRIWLQNILRGELGFEGMIFSDDLSMEGASTAGGIVERADAAFAAGCDMVLVCNAPHEAKRLLDGLAPQQLDQQRALRMLGDSSMRNDDTYWAALLLTKQSFG
ncbi:MAG: beta-N-acetylhexosaminidase [Burkholderiales bacterium]